MRSQPPSALFVHQLPFIVLHVTTAHLTQEFLDLVFLSEKGVWVMAGRGDGTFSDPEELSLTDIDLQHKTVPLGKSKKVLNMLLTPLTRKQVEIVSLAATGLTCSEIAGRLFLSRRTVEGHLAKAMAKLGVQRKRHLVTALELEQLQD